MVQKRFVDKTSENRFKKCKFHIVKKKMVAPSYSVCTRNRMVEIHESVHDEKRRKREVEIVKKLIYNIFTKQGGDSIVLI